MYTVSTLAKIVLKSFMVAKSRKVHRPCTEKAQDVVVLSHDIRRKSDNSKYAVSWGFEILVDNSVWLCYLTGSNSEIVTNFGDNLGEISTSCVGKWKAKINIYVFCNISVQMLK